MYIWIFARFYALTPAKYYLGYNLFPENDRMHNAMRVVGRTWTLRQTQVAWKTARGSVTQILNVGTTTCQCHPDHNAA